MGISDGTPANAANFNSAFLSRTDTQELQNKTVTGASNNSLLQTNTTTGIVEGIADTPVAEEFLKFDGTDYVWDTAGGAGVGGINYITNFDAETGLTTGWATYNDSSGGIPNDGTGGTANITLTAQNTTVLRGAYSFQITKDAANRQGEGVSYDFTIDDQDKGSPIYVSFDYSVTANYVTGDIDVFVYDVTNATLVTVTKNVSSKRFTGVFYGTDSTSYRFILHVTSVNALAYDMIFDNVRVGPDEIIDAPIVTEWEDYPVVIGAGVGALTNYTVTASYKRIGSDLYIRGELEFTGAPGTWTNPSISIPAGLEIKDFSQVANFPVTLNHGVLYDAILFPATNQSFIVLVMTDSGHQDCTNLNPFTWVSGDKIAWTTGPIEITSWSAENSGLLSTTQLLNASAHADINQLVGQSIPLGTVALIGFDTVNSDNTNSWRPGVGYNSTTGAWTTNPAFVCPKNGYLSVETSVTYAAILPTASTSVALIDLIKNGSAVKSLDRRDSFSTTNAIFPANNGAAVIEVLKGDEISIGTLHTLTAAGNASLFSGSTQTWVTFTYVPDLSVYGVLGGENDLVEVFAQPVVVRNFTAANEWQNINSLTLPAGTWDITGTIMIRQPSGVAPAVPFDYITALSIDGSVGVIVPSDKNSPKNTSHYTYPAGLAQFHSARIIVEDRFVLPTTTTVYLKDFCAIINSTNIQLFEYKLSARRVQ